MESRQKIIIDGYNVIYTNDHLRRIAVKDLERARNEFINKLKRYLSRKQLQITVVFDGKGRMLEAQSIVPGRLQIVFSRGMQNADQFIVSMLRESSNPKEYIVVTSDMNDIGRIARGLGTTVVGSKKFLIRVLGGHGRAMTKSEKPDPSKIDMEYWLEHFENHRPESDGSE